MAGKKGVQVVDFSTLPLSLIGQDGLHPTEDGYNGMAEISFDAIKATYEKADAIGASLSGFRGLPTVARASSELNSPLQRTHAFSMVKFVLYC